MQDALPLSYPAGSWRNHQLQQYAQTALSHLLDAVLWMLYVERPVLCVVLSGILALLNTFNSYCSELLSRFSLGHTHRAASLFLVKMSVPVPTNRLVMDDCCESSVRG